MVSEAPRRAESSSRSQHVGRLVSFYHLHQSESKTGEFGGDVPNTLVLENLITKSKSMGMWDLLAGCLHTLRQWNLPSGCAAQAWVVVEAMGDGGQQKGRGPLHGTVSSTGLGGSPFPGRVPGARFRVMLLVLLSCSNWASLSGVTDGGEPALRNARVPSDFMRLSSLPSQQGEVGWTNWLLFCSPTGSFLEHPQREEGRCKPQLRQKTVERCG